MVRENITPNNGGNDPGEKLPPQELSKLTTRVIALNGPLEMLANVDMSKEKNKAETKQALIDIIFECDNNIFPKLDQIGMPAVINRFKETYKKARLKLSELEQDEKKS